VQDMKHYSTPGTPRFKIVRPNDEMDGVDAMMQSRYRSGVGMLLYLIKHSRPDIANVVRVIKVYGQHNNGCIQGNAESN
jgi:hypothetical protein